MQHQTLLSSLLALLALSPAALAGGDITVDGGRGPVIVQVPASYDPAVPMPLVLLLHPFGSNSAQIQAYLNIGPLAEQFGFCYLAPNGTTNNQGQRFWNATGACCDFFNSNVDDSSYLRDLVDQAKLQLNIDPTQVHVGGHSNGGFMSHRMACDHSESFASLVSLAGASFNNPALCAPEQPVHALQIHGTADGTIFYAGGNIGGTPYPGAVASIEQWANTAGCDLSWVAGAPLDLDTSVAGTETSVRRYEVACSAEGSADLWRMAGVGHTPFLSSSFTPEVVDWMLSHPKPEVSTNYCIANDHSGGRSASIVAVGSASVADQTLRLIAYGAPAGTPAIFIASPNQNQAPFGDGFLCIAGPIQRIQPALITTDGGEAYRSLDFGANYGALLVPGADVNFQLWFRDVPAGGAGFNTSDACTMSLLP